MEENWEYNTGDPPEVYICAMCGKDHDLEMPCTAMEIQPGGLVKSKYKRIGLWDWKSGERQQSGTGRNDGDT